MSISCAQHVKSHSHAARNAIAAVKSATHLVADEEISAALADAASQLQIATEQQRALALIELDLLEPAHFIPISQLLDWAQRRAQREGSTARIDTSESDVPKYEIITVSALCERLFVDLIHCMRDDSSPVVIRRAPSDQIQVELELVPELALDQLNYLETLATACKCQIKVGASCVLTFDSA